MTADPERVTVVVPARNEEADLGACLDAVLAQDLPGHRLEVLVVDGGSTDRTRAVAEDRLAGADLARWVVVPNPVGTTPSNLNRGLAEATGAVLCRVDARSRIPADYVRRCAELLTRRPELAVVGGAQVAVPAGDGWEAVAIARALNNRFGMGGSRYRRGAASGPSDTVYLGAFRTEDLRGVGGWDERLGTNQDFDLNRRLAARGTVWFEADLDVAYVPRARLGALWSQYRRFGRGKVRYWELTGDRPNPRQVVLLVAPVAAAAVLAGALVRASWRQRLALVVAGLGAGVVVEGAGTAGPPAPPATRAVAVVASGVVAVGWLSGVWGAVAGRALGRDVEGTARGVSR